MQLKLFIMRVNVLTSTHYYFINRMNTLTKNYGRIIQKQYNTDICEIGTRTPNNLVI